MKVSPETGPGLTFCLENRLGTCAATAKPFMASMLPTAMTRENNMMKNYDEVEKVKNV